MSGDVTILVKDLTRRFKRQVALSDVTLEIGRGEIHALLGPNGAGKTTLMKILAGLTAPSSGTVEVLGGSPNHRAIRARIGWVPSTDRSFYLRLTGAENLRFFARMYGIDPKTAQRRALELLELVGLAEAAKKRAGLYSHGMLKRLAMARALMADPEVLLLDEATHDLDPLGSEDVKAITRSLSRNGATVVWATQRLAELSGFAHTTTVLQDGVTRFSGPVSELSHLADVRSFRLRFDGEVPKTVEGSGVDLEATEAPGVLIAHLSGTITLGEVISGFTAAGFQITSCTEVTSEIESAFLRLVT